MTFSYATFCSGIGAPELAWSRLGWRPLWASEIEPFPSAVLAHHHPDLPNLGDMETINGSEAIKTYGRPDVVCAGTPCQSFSVAGLRAGMDDPRGNLALVYLRLVDEMRPDWIVWENVPGVLSSGQGRDFGSFLGALAELRYGFAWRILDAQWWGVAQRRRRVFVVGHSSGDWRRPAAVLLESASLRGDPAPSREAGEGVTHDVAPCVGASGRGFDRTGETRGQDPVVAFQSKASASQSMNPGPVASTCDASKAAGMAVCFGGNRTSGPIDTATARNAHGGPHGGLDFESETFAVDFLRDTLHNQGIRQEESHASTQKAYPEAILSRMREEVGEEAFAKWGLGILDSLQSAEVLRQKVHGQQLRRKTRSDGERCIRKISCAQDCRAWTMQTLREAGCVRHTPPGREHAQQLFGELGAYLSVVSSSGAQQKEALRDLWKAAEGIGVLRQALSAIQEMGKSAQGKAKPAHPSYGVRRLTVTETERLQGFPDGYTLIPSYCKGAPKAHLEDVAQWLLRGNEGTMTIDEARILATHPDGPRYRALGNSMAVPVMRWIGERIQAVHELPKEETK